MSRKKVILRTVNDTLHPGYLEPSGIVQRETVDLLDLDGRIASFPLAGIRSICYVRDFNLTDTVGPERLVRRTFLARPRTEGLWLRVTLHGAEPLEGLAASDTSLLDALIEDRGLYLTPPDTRANTQRVFLPRTAIAELKLLAVVTTPSKPKPAQPADDLQDDLFA
ncbi:DUF6982 domain-containing protein [Granulicella rosea]|nr:hypothetical protein [Granulicella rosea]